MPWEEVEVDFYAKKLPLEIERLWRKIKDYNTDISGLTLCKDFSEAMRLLAFSNQGGDINEICSIFSPKLAELKGTVELQGTFLPIGYDVVSIGHWPLIAEGVLAVQEFYDQWVSRLNQNCLISDPILAPVLGSDYDMWAEKKLVEEMIKEPFGIEAVSISILESENEINLPRR